LVPTSTSTGTPRSRHPGGTQHWGVDERFDDLRHLNRAGQDGWQAYDRHARLIGQPRLNTVTYSMRRTVS
jgi:hypothetical protein